MLALTILFICLRATLVVEPDRRVAAMIGDTFIVVLMIHPTLSGMAMQFFRCRDIEGVTYLMVDYGLRCYDSVVSQSGCTRS